MSVHWLVEREIASLGHCTASVEKTTVRICGRWVPGWKVQVWVKSYVALGAPDMHVAAFLTTYDHRAARRRAVELARVLNRQFASGSPAPSEVISC